MFCLMFGAIECDESIFSADNDFVHFQLRLVVTSNVHLWRFWRRRESFLIFFDGDFTSMLHIETSSLQSTQTCQCQPQVSREWVEGRGRLGEGHHHMTSLSMQFLPFTSKDFSFGSNCAPDLISSQLLTVATHSWSSAVKDVTAPIIINKASAHLGPFLPDVVLHWPVSVCVLDLHPEDPTLYTTVISHNIREVDSVPLSLQHSAGLTLKTLNQPKLLMFQEFHLCRQHIHVWSEASKQSGLSEHMTWSFQPAFSAKNNWRPLKKRKSPHLK